MIARSLKRLEALSTMKWAGMIKAPSDAIKNPAVEPFQRK